ncbi:MAG: DUF924 domain-containing protein [Paracoccaceae bacterium]|nr:DUF924 domain-containing protein [Paracoccaceae bacterium]
MSSPEDVLDYWLGAIGPEGWYAAGAALDADVRERFEDLWRAALGGGLDHWVAGPGPSLAFIVLTDQFPRNMFRDRAEAFATDALALAAAKVAVAQGWDMVAPEPERQFFYMPFEHSEDAEDQETAVALMTERMPENPGNLLHARAHQEMIRRFGRFPARNAVLGRVNTPEEAAFLAEGGYGALVRMMQN